MAATIDPQVNPSNTVFVSNVSPAATEKNISDFFSFCGPINRLFLKREQETCSAVVEFQHEAAAKTALLLTNALIIDRPITVTPFSSSPKPNESSVTETANQVPKSNITERNFGDIPDEQRTKTSVVASMLGAGYVLGKDAVDKAVQYDKDHKMSDKVSQAMQSVKTKVVEVDSKLKISENAAAVGKKISDKTVEIDNKLQISRAVRSASQSAKDAATNLNAKLHENETFSKGMTSVTGFFNSVGQAANTAFTDLQSQTNKVIAEKQQQKQQSQPDPSNPQPESSQIPQDSNQQQPQQSQQQPPQSQQIPPQQPIPVPATTTPTQQQ